MRILAFGAKVVGYETVEYLLDRWPDDDYTFVLPADEATSIGALVERHGRAFTVQGPNVLTRIAEQPEGHYDWLLNLWGSEILRPAVLSRAKRSLNIHPSLLPYGRGRDPVVWSIRRGWPAGMTLHQIVEGVDEGPVWYQEEVPYSLPCTGKELYERVVARCGKAFCEQWPHLRMIAGEPVPQADGFPTQRRRDLFPDRRIDADAHPAAREVVLKLLAHDFSPGYTARVVLNGQTYDATLTLTPSAD